MSDRDDRQIIQRAADEVGNEIGSLQGRLFAVEAKAESLRARIARLDVVYQNLRAQLQQQKPAFDAEDVLKTLKDLSVLDPDSQQVCNDVAGLLKLSTQVEARQAAICRMESRAWKQGEAIALAQQVVQSLRERG